MLSQLASLMVRFSSVQTVRPQLPNGIQTRTNNGSFGCAILFFIFEFHLILLWFLSVVSYDPIRLQFAADLQIPAQDPGSLYILSSRFHRYFLRNLDTRDINVRILRISSATGPASNLHHSTIPTLSPGFSSATTSYGLVDSLKYRTTSPVIYKTEVSLAGTRPILNDVKSSYVENYFNSIRQPYQYEPVGIINSAKKNPFTALNTGERPNSYLKSTTFNSFNHQPTHATNFRPSQPFIDQSSYVSYLSKINPQFNDFNSLRRAKSISYNSTVLH